jgi:hypothetical protein
VAYSGNVSVPADEAEPGADGDRPRMSLLAYAEAVTVETDSDMPF